MKENYGSRNERLVTGVRRDESVNRKQNQGAITIFKKGGLPQEIKENPDFIKTPKGGAILLNFDNDESVQMVYTCFRTNKVLVNPLINWTEDDVWKYIMDEHLPINPLYECGYSRVGCVGCPMGSYHGRMREFERYPKYKERYIRIANKIIEWRKQHHGANYNGLETGLKYFKQWMEDPNVDGQLSFDMLGNITEDYT